MLTSTNQLKIVNASNLSERHSRPSSNNSINMANSIQLKNFKMVQNKPLTYYKNLFQDSNQQIEDLLINRFHSCQILSCSLLKNQKNYLLAILQLQFDDQSKIYLQKTTPRIVLSIQFLHQKKLKNNFIEFTINEFVEEFFPPLEKFQPLFRFN